MFQERALEPRSEISVDMDTDRTNGFQRPYRDNMRFMNNHEHAAMRGLG